MSTTLALLSASDAINSNGYANVTLDSYLPVWSNAISISNSVFFLAVYSVYLVCSVAFLIRASRKIKINANHKKLFALTILFVIIQCINLLVRICYDSVHIRARIIAETGSLVEWSFFVVLQTLGGFTTAAMYINYISLFEILFFVQRML